MTKYLNLWFQQRINEENSERLNIQPQRNAEENEEAEENGKNVDIQGSGPKNTKEPNTNVSNSLYCIQ